jgi:TPR repeat protein
MKPLSSSYPLAIAVLALSVSTMLQAQSDSHIFTAGQFDLLKKTWNLLPDDGLLKAAQANNREAQYFYWRRVFDKNLQEENQLWYEIQGLGAKLPPGEWQSMWGKWQNVPNEEVNQKAQQGDIEAAITLKHRKSKADADQVTTSFPFLEKSAAQGFPPAEGDAASFYLGVAGYRVTDVDLPKGLELMQRSADHGWAQAEYQMGCIYLHGHLLPPDFSKAVRYFQESADQDGPRSQYELARLYANGYGVPRDDGDTPIALLRKSAAKNNLPALHELGERYRVGLGVPRDYIEAARYYEIASQVSQNGGYDPDRLGQLINDLLDSNLSPKPSLTREIAPFAKVAGVYLKAVRLHDAAAMSQIAKWYQSGRFGPLDRVKALQWYRLAAGSGNPDAQAQEDQLKARLSPDELERASRDPLRVGDNRF